MTEEPKRGMVSWSIKLMWLSGQSVKAIAMLSRRTPGSIRGIVHRAFSTPREELSLEQRQALLDDMKRDRQDDGRMPDRYFVAGPIAAAPVAAKMVLKERPKPQKSAIPPAAPKPPKQTQTQRKKSAHRAKQEAMHKAKLEREAREAREAGGNHRRGLHGSALEYLHDMRILADPQDRFVDAAPRGPEGMLSHTRRKEAGLALRACIEACRVGGMSSVDFEREVRGGGAALGIAWWKLMQLDSLGAVRKAMGAADFELVEAVVDRDEMPWEGVTSAVAKKLLYENIRRGLDVVACLWSFMEAGEFEKRWGYAVPKIDGLDDDEAREISRLARSLIRDGMRSA